MTAQLYDTKNNNFFTAYIPNEPPYSYDFYLGEFSAWNVLKNTSNEFISLGGDRDNPLIYKYQNTGITDFTFSILAPTFPQQRGLPPEEAIYPSLAYYELWIDGIKPYYFYFGLQNETIFTRTVSVVANKDQTTKFRFRLTFYFSATTYKEVQKFYFRGDTNTVYSSITAKFIPDLPMEENKVPIVITEDSVLSLNRRHIIKAPLLKTINLSMDENCKVGDWIEIKNMDVGNFQINSGAYIDILMNGLITRVKNGYIRSKKRGDFIRLECMEVSPRIIFSDTNTIGNFTLI